MDTVDHVPATNDTGFWVFLALSHWLSSGELPTYQQYVVKKAKPQ